MPRRPDFSQHRPDPRFDSYRDRVGRLYRGEDAVGWVLVLVEAYAMQVGGHLWWTRWGPTRDWLWEWTVVDGDFSDTFVPEDAADEVLSDYDSGRFDYYGEAMRVIWMEASESSPSDYGVWSSAGKSSAATRREEHQHMRWLRRVLGMFEDGWPTRTPPTVPPAGPAVFHCPACKEVVQADASACPACGGELTDTG